MSISKQPGMGAIPNASGVAFRVWAPNAASVSVAGTFNGWSKTATPLASEGNGYWSADEPIARISDEYKFLLINRDSGVELWKNDPYARQLTSGAGPVNSVIADPDFTWTTTGYSSPSWNEMVIYELHIGTFLFDPVNPRKRGSFKSLISKLDYLKELGINAIEVMASGEFETDTSWGYNPAYIFAIESDYGGPNGFRDFVNQAHQRGIAVIFDVVYNHLGPQGLDMWQFDGWQLDGHGGIYFYNDWRRYTLWAETRPDYGRGEVRQYFRDNAIRWLETRYVDGLRWDATGWIRNVDGYNNDPKDDIPDGWRLMQWINSEIQAEQPWKISIAEDMQDNEWLTKEVGKGGAGFSAQWGAGFVHAIRNAIISGDDNSRDMVAVGKAISYGYNEDVFERVIYTESHDEDANGHSRVPEEIWPGQAGSYFSKKRATLGIALVLTAPGIPMLFQGQEFLEDGYFSDTRELDWSKATKNAGIVALCRDLIHLRRNWFNQTRGLQGQNLNVYHVNNLDKLIAFHRWDSGGAGDDVVVIANFANRSYANYNLGLPRAGLWRVRFNSDWNGYSPDFSNQFSYDTQANPGGRDTMSVNANIGIGPYSVIILSQDRFGT